MHSQAISQLGCPIPRTIHRATQSFRLAGTLLLINLLYPNTSAKCHYSMAISTTIGVNKSDQEQGAYKLEHLLCTWVKYN